MLQMNMHFISLAKLYKMQSDEIKIKFMNKH